MKYCILAFCCIFQFSIGFAEPLKITVPGDVLKDYNQFIKGKNLTSMNDFSGPGSRRDVVEVILIQQALFQGGFSDSIKLIPVGTYRREISLIKEGRAIMSATSLWLVDLNKNKDHMYISDPVIKQGEFEAGFYVTPENKTALNAKNLGDIRKLRAISNKQWVIDWKTLTSLNMSKKVFHTPVWESMVRMVKIGRADFLLAPFQSTSDLSLEAEGIKMIPIPNLKIGLQGSRHFGISKSHKNGKLIFEKFNQGLQKLHSQGIIHKAYSQSGFFNTRTQDWLKVN